MRCTGMRLLCWSLLALGVFSVLLVLSLDLFLPWEDDDYEIAEMEDLAGGGAVNFTDRRHVKISLAPEEPTELPVIVWWTAFTPSLRDERRCSKGKCLITQSRTELTNPRVNVSAFMYYGTEFHLHDLPLPRKPHHLWALLHEESPKNNWLLATKEGISLFNLTSTCSRHSDYPLHLQYLHNFDMLLQPMRTPVSEKSREGRGLVLFLQSACNPPSDRDSYVRELMKHVSVDCLGKCLHNRDLPGHLVNPLTFNSEEVLDIVSKYKFALSFENALCHDYMTEKFWRPLYAGSVPIVRGSPSIKDWDPSGTHPSIIVAEDFANPKALAKFLLELDKNDTEYNEYLKFKTTGVTNKLLLEHFKARKWVVDGVGEWMVDGVEQRGNFVEGFECFVCDKLYEMREAERQGRKMTLIADTPHYDCPSPVPSVRREAQSIDNRLEEISQVDKEAGESLHYWMWNAKRAKINAATAYKYIGMGAGQKELDWALDPRSDL